MLYSVLRLLRLVKGDKNKPIDVVKEGKWKTEDNINVHYLIVKLGKPIPIVNK